MEKKKKKKKKEKKERGRSRGRQRQQQGAAVGHPAGKGEEGGGLGGAGSSPILSVGAWEPVSLGIRLTRGGFLSSLNHPQSIPMPTPMPISTISLVFSLDPRSLTPANRRVHAEILLFDFVR